MADKQITPFQLTDQFTMDNFNQRINETNIALQSKPNPNLLDNWYFGNPVNQRGQTEYTGNNIYCIDRFICYGLNVSVSNSCLKLSSSENWYSRIGQKIEPHLLNVLSGKQVTMTALLKSSKAGQVKISLYDSTDDFSTGTEKIETTTGDVQLVTTTFTIPPSFSNHKVETLFYPDYTKNGQETELYALKLELGSTQTLAHQDENGNWVLNEIPDYGEQLRRCMRYYQRITNPSRAFLGISTVNGNEIWIPILTVPMRTKPTITTNNVTVYKISTNSQHKISSTACYYINGGYPTITVYTEDAIGAGAMVMLNGESNAYLELNAEL